MQNTNIDYIRKEIPVIDIPVYDGERYEDRVPDTLEISEMAELVINALTEATNPDMDYELYCEVELVRNPPIMRRDFGDWCQYKFWEALPLMRLITGSSTNIHVDDVWKDVILKSIGPDGLFYFPSKSFPWWDIKSGFPYVYRPDGTMANVDDSYVNQLTNAYVCGRVLNTIIIYYIRDKNVIWKEIIEKMIDRLLALAVDKGDYCYFDYGLFEPEAKVPSDTEVTSGMTAVEVSARLIEAPAKYYKLTGYKPAKILAEKLTNHMRYHANYFDVNGGFIIEKSRALDIMSNKDVEAVHFHGHAIGVLNMLEYAIVIGDRELLEFIWNSYKWMKANGSYITGFFPELLFSDYPSAEACALADMIAIALKLTVTGLYDCWDDVDRWIRNQFTEDQLANIDWIKRVSKTMPFEVPGPHETDDRVAARNIGGFASWPSANDWCVYDGKINLKWKKGHIRQGIMHCCTGNAARTIYYIWENLQRFDKNELRVNLLLNSTSVYADVYSYIPYEGRVDIKVKQNCENVLVRMPEWVKAIDKDVVCKMNGIDSNFTIEGRYINIGTARQGDVISITFPIHKRIVKETIGGVEFTLEVKGNTVISIDPPGKNNPYYQRDYYRSNTTKWKDVKRFVSKKKLEW